MNDYSAAPSDGTVGVMIVGMCTVVRSGFRHMLGAYPGFSVLAESRTATEGLPLIHRLRPQVVLVTIDQLDDFERAVGDGSPPRIPDSVLVAVGEADWDVHLARAWETRVSGFVDLLTEPSRLAEVLRQAAVKFRSFTSEQQARIQLRQQGLGQRLASLSPRERQVFRLLRSGKRSDEIVAELVVSPHTAAKQVASVQSKLGVHSQVKLMALTMQHHLEHW